MMVNYVGLPKGSVLVLLTAALWSASCDGPQGVTGPGCVQGSKGCSCYGNDTCNVGLTCESEICVATSGEPVGGSNAGGASGGANSTQGGTTVVGNGGATLVGSGGATVVGNGGATVVGNGGATVVGNGGATLVGSGGATVVGNGGATLVGTGGTTLTATGGTVAGPNLIRDPRFQLFDSYWNITLNAGDSGTYTQPPTATAVCVTNTSTDPLNYELAFSLGYPNFATDTFVIEPGATYTLTYTVSATYALMFEVKIGHSVSPYTEIYSYTSDLLTSAYKTFSHQFTSVAGDTSAGLVFNPVIDYGGKICFQQVTLTKN